MNNICEAAHSKLGGKKNMEKQTWRPGEEAPRTGNYTAYDKEGRNGGSVYLEKGKRFPATQHEGSYYTEE